MKKIRIGTRRSRLSLWQANHIADRIRARHPRVAAEIREYRTRSDLKPTAPLSSFSGTGIFTDALETALQAREIDAAVHSLKDLPVEMAPGLALAAVAKRGDHRDALVSRSGAGLSLLPEGACIGTGSLRRRAQLLAMRPDLKLAQIRGNVPTRLEKLYAEEGRYDAIVLAAAGLKRLGLASRITEVFTDSQMLCAAGQGAIALQCRAEADDLAFFSPMTDWKTSLATRAERAFLHAFDSGCSLPVAAYAHVAGDRLRLQGRVIALAGAPKIDVAADCAVIDGPSGEAKAQALGIDLAEQARALGADEILESIESEEHGE